MIKSSFSRLAIMAVVAVDGWGRARAAGEC